MEVKILWTDFALSQLEDIYDFYKYKANPRTAKKIVKSIISLESNPLIGVKEPLLSTRQFEYRFIVKKNYKII